VVDSISEKVSIPVLVCAYSRRIEFQNMITSLVDSGCEKIYINIDGSNHYHTQLEQKLMRDFVANIRLGSPAINVIARQSKENLGAAVSIINSLDWFFSQEEVGLIFEDDLEFDPSIFQFSDWALNHYANDPEVWIVAGSNFFSEHPQLQRAMHTTNYPVTWGWGTWRDKWMTMRSSIVNQAPQAKLFNSSHVKAFWSVGAQRAKAGFVDAWDIPLAEAMNRIGSKTVVPPFNLVRNIGFSDLASNTHELRFPLNHSIDSGIENWNPNLSFENTVLGKEKINSLYETHIYGIRKRHLLSPLFSRFDGIRFREMARSSLSSRLDKIEIEGFIDF
jgi:hypothetical protein